MTTIKRIEALEDQLKPRGQVPCIEGLPTGEAGPSEYLNTLTGEITPALPERGIIIARVGIDLGAL